MRDKRQRIENSALFKGLPDPFIDEICEQLHPRTIPAGTMVMMEEHNTPAVSLIIRGTVKITVMRQEREALLNIVGPGELLGELNLLDGQGHSADILTLEETTLLWMERDRLAAYMQTYPGIGINIAKILSRRLRLATSRIEALSTLDVPGRVAHQLLRLAAEYGETGALPGTHIPLCLTQHDLAAMVGATRTRVNQALMAMRRAQLISISKDHHITVLNAQLMSQRYLGST